MPDQCTATTARGTRCRARARRDHRGFPAYDGLCQRHFDLHWRARERRRAEALAIRRTLPDLRHAVLDAVRVWRHWPTLDAVDEIAAAEELDAMDALVTAWDALEAAEARVRELER